MTHGKQLSLVIVIQPQSSNDIISDCSHLIHVCLWHIDIRNLITISNSFLIKYLEILYLKFRKQFNLIWPVLSLYL